MLTKARKAIIVSWTLWFAGIFATFLLGAIKANLDAGIMPPVTINDAVNALWAAIGASVAVMLQYLDKKYTRYGVSASTANDVSIDPTTASESNTPPTE